MSFQWGHAVTYVNVKGFMKAYCVCGWQSERHPTVEEATSEYQKHVGLVEKRRSA